MLPDQLITEGCVQCIAGQISFVGDATECPAFDGATYNLDGQFLLPGFIDIHVHGGRGADFMDGTVEAVKQVCDAHLEHGTTTIFPTTTTGSPDEILSMIQACEEARSLVKSRLGGVHLYGPFFASNKVGCHSAAGRRDPSSDNYQIYFDAGEISIATCAAELEGASEFYQHAQQHAKLLTCGHSNSSFTEMESAFENGVRHVDHFWCAMSSVPSLRQRFNVPMQASMAEFVLMNQEMSTEVIADGQHLAPELLEFAYRMLGPKRLCLVTDCNRALDLPPGDYKFGHSETGSEFKSDGKVGWAPDGNSLASSIMGMDHMVRHMKANTSASLADVVRMASLTPAELTGIASETGSIEVGKSADLLVLNDDLHVQQRFVAGMLVG